MADYRKYLVTTDPETGETVKVEEIGDAGDLSEVAAETVFPPSTTGSQQPQYVVNIFIGTGPGGAGSPSVTTQRFGRSPERAGVPLAKGPKSPGGPVAKGPKSPGNGPQEPDDDEKND